MNTLHYPDIERCKKLTQMKFPRPILSYYSGSMGEEEYSLYLSEDEKNKLWSFIETIREEALKEGEEMGEKIGIAKCINLIPEQKAIVPLGGDNKYYAGYNAGIRLTRDNFDKYFKSL